MKKDATADIIWAVILCCGAIGLLLFSYKPQEASLYSNLGGMFWPRILLWSILLISSLMLVIALHSRPVKGDRNNADRWKYPKTLILVFLACFGYFLLLDVIGFVLSTLLYLGIMLVILGVQNKAKITIYPVIAVAIYWFLFVQILKVPLPRGVGIFREISILLFHY
jgi:putative tricarboxylic transport membrane protein